MRPREEINAFLATLVARLNRFSHPLINLEDVEAFFAPDDYAALYTWLLPPYLVLYDALPPRTAIVCPGDVNPWLRKSTTELITGAFNAQNCVDDDIDSKLPVYDIHPVAMHIIIILPPTKNGYSLLDATVSISPLSKAKIGAIRAVITSNEVMTRSTSHGYKHSSRSLLAEVMPP